MSWEDVVINEIISVESLEARQKYRLISIEWLIVNNKFFQLSQILI